MKTLENSQAQLLAQYEAELRELHEETAFDLQAYQPRPHYDWNQRARELIALSGPKGIHPENLRNIIDAALQDAEVRTNGEKEFIGEPSDPHVELGNILAVIRALDSTLPVEKRLLTPEIELKIAMTGELNTAVTLQEAADELLREKAPDEQMKGRVLQNLGLGRVRTASTFNGRLHKMKALHRDMATISGKKI